MDRRAYLKTVGAGGAVALAGCLGGNTGGGETTTTSGDGGEGTTAGTTTSSGQQVIVAGTAPGFPPFEIKEGGELTGFDVELLEAVVGQTDYTFDGWREFEFDTLIPALTEDRIDVIAAAMTITDERDESIDFSDPYYEADQSILVRADGDFSPSSLDDLSGHPVGAQKGTTGESVVKSELVEAGKLEESNYKAYDNYTLAVQDLENGNIDAIVIDKPVAQTFQAQRQVSIAFTYETGERYGFGVREGDSARQQALNQGLQAVRDSGTYEELRKKGESKEKAARIANAQSNPDQEPSKKGGKGAKYEDRTKEELYQKAKEVGIEGRSKMNKQQLIDALNDE